MSKNINYRTLKKITGISLKELRAKFKELNLISNGLILECYIEGLETENGYKCFYDYYYSKIDESFIVNILQNGGF